MHRTSSYVIFTFFRLNFTTQILSPKQILRRLPIPLALAKAGNRSENSLNSILNAKWMLYLSILKIAERLIFMGYYLIFQIN